MTDDAGFSRRNLLALGAAGGGALLVGTGGPARAARHGALITRNEIWGQSTYYLKESSVSSFQYDPSFYGRLESWMQFWNVNGPAGWLVPFKIRTYGTHVDRGSAAHDYGRGFDLTGITAMNAQGGAIDAFDAFYKDRDDGTKGWGNHAETAVRDLKQRRYWATAASLHYTFQHVLTYQYNTDHYDHIHIDNLKSGSGVSVFSTASQAQVEFVQASLRFVWGYSDVWPTGTWNATTATRAAQAVQRAGKSGSLTSAAANWQTFCLATFKFGTGSGTF